MATPRSAPSAPSFPVFSSPRSRIGRFLCPGDMTRGESGGVVLGSDKAIEVSLLSFLRELEKKRVCFVVAFASPPRARPRFSVPVFCSSVRVRYRSAPWDWTLRGRGQRRGRELSGFAWFFPFSFIAAAAFFFPSSRLLCTLVKLLFLPVPALCARSRPKAPRADQPLVSLLRARCAFFREEERALRRFLEPSKFHC